MQFLMNTCTFLLQELTVEPLNSIPTNLLLAHFRTGIFETKVYIILENQLGIV